MDIRELYKMHVGKDAVNGRNSLLFPDASFLSDNENRTEALSYGNTCNTPYESVSCRENGMLQSCTITGSEKEDYHISDFIKPEAETSNDMKKNIPYGSASYRSREIIPEGASHQKYISNQKPNRHDGIKHMAIEGKKNGILKNKYGNRDTKGDKRTQGASFLYKNNAPSQPGNKQNTDNKIKQGLSFGRGKLMGVISDAAKGSVSPENHIRHYAKIKSFKHMLVDAKADEIVMSSIKETSGAVIKTGRVMLKPLMSLIKKLALFAGVITVIFVLCFSFVFYGFIFILSAADDTFNDSVNEEYTGYDGYDIKKGQMNNGYVFYNQGDYPQPMGVENGRVLTLAGSGCGLTALASAVATWTGNTDITPVTVLNYGLNGQSGNSAPVVLVSSALFSGFCKKYGVSYRYVDATSGNLNNALNEGHSLICMLDDTCYFTDGSRVTYRTHFLVLIGYGQNGNIACMNPNGGRLCYISPETVLRVAGHFHEIWKDKETETDR